MKNLSEVIFVDSLPTLDLHGIDRDYARLKINEFIDDNIKMGNHIISIVHGFGTGVLARTTKEILTKNKNVLEFQRFRGNSGCTIVKIKNK